MEVRHLRNQGMETFNGERARAKRGDARTVEGREPLEEKGEKGTGKGTLSHGRRRGREQQKHQVESHAVSATFFRTMQMLLILS